MLRRDLEAVCIPYSVEGPDGPEYADFHALRHTYLTMLGRNGVDLRTAQELAGHSKPELTARYSHRRLYDLAGAVDKLPNLVPPDAKPDADAIPLRLTGTDAAVQARANRSTLADAGRSVRRTGSGTAAKANAPDNAAATAPTRGSKSVVPGVVTGGIRPHQFAFVCTTGQNPDQSGDAKQTPQNMRPGAVLHRAASDCTSEPGGTRTLDQRINLPHGLSPAVLLRSGLYHLPRPGRSGAARQVSEDPGRSIGLGPVFPADCPIRRIVTPCPRTAARTDGSQGVPAYGAVLPRAFQPGHSY
jgi:Phage integrase family